MLKIITSKTQSQKLKQLAKIQYRKANKIIKSHFNFNLYNTHTGLVPNHSLPISELKEFAKYSIKTKDYITLTEII